MYFGQIVAVDFTVDYFVHSPELRTPRVQSWDQLYKSVQVHDDAVVSRVSG